MQSSRLLSILLRLQTQGRVSARVLAEALEVSVRTIYRDVDALSAAGVPVYAQKGRDGGFALRDGYRTRLTGLDRPEAESLFLAGVPFAAAQLGLGPALSTTRLKLLAALPEAAQRDAQRVASRFHLDPVAWFQGPDEQGLLPELAAAVWAARMVEMRYDSWKGLVERRVAPLGLVLKGGLWYLVAAANGQARTYRVGCIESLAVDEAPAPAPQGFDLQRYWDRFARDYEARMQAGRAKVRAARRAQAPGAHEPGHGAGRRCGSAGRSRGLARADHSHRVHRRGGWGSASPGPRRPGAGPAGIAPCAAKGGAGVGRGLCQGSPAPGPEKLTDVISVWGASCAPALVQGDAHPA